MHAPLTPGKLQPGLISRHRHNCPPSPPSPRVRRGKGVFSPPVSLSRAWSLTATTTTAALAPPHLHAKVWVCLQIPFQVSLCRGACRSRLTATTIAASSLSPLHASAKTATATVVPLPPPPLHASGACLLTTLLNPLQTTLRRAWSRLTAAPSPPPLHASTKILTLHPQREEEDGDYGERQKRDAGR